MFLFDATDPKFITSAEWQVVANLVLFLWIVVICNVAFAGSMLLAHIVIPSLQSTGQLSENFAKFRPLLTFIGLMALAGTIFAVASWLLNLPVLFEIFPQRLA